MVSSSSGLRSAGILPPAAVMSACTAASQANVSTAAGTLDRQRDDHNVYLERRTNQQMIHPFFRDFAVFASLSSPGYTRRGRRRRPHVVFGLLER